MYHNSSPRSSPGAQQPNYYDGQAGPSNYMDHPLQQDSYDPPPRPQYVQQHSSYSEYSEEDDKFDEEPFDINKIDPALRLRTTRTAHSVIAESIRSEDARAHRKRSRLFAGLKRKGTVTTGTFGFSRKSKRTSDMVGQVDEHGLPAIAQSEAGGSQAGDASPPPSTTDANGKVKKVLPRRTIFVNLPLPMGQVDKIGEPLVRYVRNKVRTSKYTIVTFIPRNLFEQFHRVANIYFLGLVILQLFPIFGATTPEIAMLPLVAILGMTAIKDGIEDWRRAQLDEEVNVSPATKLGNWRNVNQPKDPRNWLERLFRLGPSEYTAEAELTHRPYQTVERRSQIAR